MTKRRVTNVAASVRQRLQNIARAANRPFQEVLQYYAMERFLFRLSKSSHTDNFVLKGALMFNVWRTPTSRPTKDIDLLGHLENSIDSVTAVMHEICRQSAPADGLTFDPDSVTGMLITDDADYEGVRVTFKGFLESSRISMVIDVGFGDVVYPSPEEAEYPAMLDDEPPKLRGYSRETAIAEKFEAMVKLGMLNSRMKDFYDIWLLSRQFNFNGEALATAIRRTFAHRATAIDAAPIGWTSDFASDPAKVAQWRAFVQKSRLEEAPTELTTVVRGIASFLALPASALVRGSRFDHVWHAPGPWTAPS